VDGAVSHDKVTRFLSGQQYTSKDLWAAVNRRYGRLKAARVC